MAKKGFKQTLGVLLFFVISFLMGVIVGLVISKVSTDGKVLGSRELPAEEYALWVSQ